MLVFLWILCILISVKKKTDAQDQIRAICKSNIIISAHLMLRVKSWGSSVNEQYKKEMSD